MTAHRATADGRARVAAGIRASPSASRAWGDPQGGTGGRWGSRRSSEAGSGGGTLPARASETRSAGTDTVHPASTGMRNTPAQRQHRAPEQETP